MTHSGSCSNAKSCENACNNNGACALGWQLVAIVAYKLQFWNMHTFLTIKVDAISFCNCAIAMFC